MAELQADQILILCITLTAKVYDEMDFKVRTPVAEHPEIKKLLDHFGDNVGSTY